MIVCASSEINFHLCDCFTCTWRVKSDFFFFLCFYRTNTKTWSFHVSSLSWLLSFYDRWLVVFYRPSFKTDENFHLISTLFKIDSKNKKVWFPSGWVLNFFCYIQKVLKFGGQFTLHVCSQSMNFNWSQPKSSGAVTGQTWLCPIAGKTLRLIRAPAINWLLKNGCSCRKGVVMQTECLCGVVTAASRCQSKETQPELARSLLCVW